MLPEAFSRLADYRIKLEQFYQSNRNYGTGACGNDGTSNTIDFSAGANKFTITCELNGPSGNTDQGYLLTATGASGSAAGHVYTIDTNNSKRTTLFKGTTAGKDCWLDKGSEC